MSSRLDAAQVLDAIAKALDHLMNGPLSEEAQLDKGAVVETLQDMARQVRSGDLPPREKRWAVLTRLVNEQWELTDPLGDEIARAEDLYRRL